MDTSIVIEAWRRGNEQAGALMAALRELSLRCMEVRGFDVHPYGAPAGVWHYDIDVIADGYHLDAATARTVAYRADPRTEPLDMHPTEGYVYPPNEEFDRLPQPRQHEYWLAWDGYDAERFWDQTGDRGRQPPNHQSTVLPDGSQRHYPTVGCQAEAWQAIIGDRTPEYYLAEYIAIGKFDRLVAAIGELPEMIAVEAGWARCMATEGFVGLAERSDAVWAAFDIYDRTSPEPSDSDLDQMRSNETALAMVDVSCAEQVGYGDARADIAANLIDSYAAEHAEELIAWEQTTARHLELATRTLTLPPEQP